MYITAGFLQPVVDVFHHVRGNDSQARICYNFHDRSDFPSPFLQFSVFQDEEEHIRRYGDFPRAVMDCIFIAPGTIDVSDIGRATDRSSGDDPTLRALEMEATHLLTTSADSVLVSDTLKSTVIKVPGRSYVRDGLPDPLELEILDTVDHGGPDGVSLRLLIAANLCYDMGEQYFTYPVVNFFRTAQGARNNPSLSLPSDEAAFLTKKRYSDFDLYSLQKDADQADQFFRWSALKSDATAAFQVGDVIVVDSDVSRRHWLPTPSAPRYPLEPLPASTLDYLASIRRTSATKFQFLADRIHRSKYFTVQITRVIGVYNSRVVVARLLSIDGDMLSAVLELPQLCIKLYDDRLTTEQPTREEVDGYGVYRNFINFVPVEEIIAAEDAAYHRLVHLQGSAIPMYYGAHSFRAPTEEVYGIVMEYIDALDLENIGMDRLPTAEQIQMIEGARHCVRALQYASVSQQDWHVNQILCRRAEDGFQKKRLACILVDLAWVSMSTNFELRRPMDDHRRARETLAEVLGERQDLLERYYAPREAWDIYHTDDPFTIPFHEIELEF
ncbi:hypothetical protein FA95DRAFT_1232609 [Auriscalpium vulgare]|uniref:Uncharacterized protein n=1 Tax=Auriscalpium vulgare TaxID=40419 RepID=A0ACB8RUS8_9AGAM|nr:hypothetical protein FA95DRAFT_1232609 [Auriscalpium vulgare]